MRRMREILLVVLVVCIVPAARAECILSPPQARAGAFTELTGVEIGFDHRIVFVMVGGAAQGSLSLGGSSQADETNVGRSWAEAIDAWLDVAPRPPREVPFVSTYRAIITYISGTEATFIVPLLAPEGRYRVLVFDEGGAERCGDRLTFEITSRYDPIKLARSLKTRGYPDNFIIETLVRSAQPTAFFDSDSPYIFGNYPASEQVAALKEVGFDSDFVSEFVGNPQQVTFGLAALNVKNVDGVVVAPMLRVLMPPRSYYKPRAAFRFAKILDLKHWLTILRDRVDLTVGYTPSVTPSGDPASPAVNLVFYGLSVELNRGAIFNLGWASGASESFKGSYVGLTLDQNFLRQVGLITE